MPTALIGVKCGSKDDGEHIAAEQMSRRLHQLNAVDQWGGSVLDNGISENGISTGPIAGVM
ncbi:hypothetical protein TrVFT333_008706 [Trichoderma virens FT-333]|nr:hypothetical protein TrVFT333_008706 [Trichoderma virens FT-333]